MLDAVAGRFAGDAEEGCASACRFDTRCLDIGAKLGCVRIGGLGIEGPLILSTARPGPRRLRHIIFDDECARFRERKTIATSGEVLDSVISKLLSSSRRPR